MELNVDLIDWTEATRRNLAGSLADDIFHIEHPSEWIRSPNHWLSDSFIQYSYVVDALNLITQHLTELNARHVSASTGRLFSPNPIYELENPMECWFLAICPESIAEISQSFASVDFRPFRSLFDCYCPEGDRPASTDDDFNEILFSYITQWREAVDDAASRNWGLIGHAG